MTLFIALVTILQQIAIALGVGSSTLAIVNFFVAISDGVIDEAERRMMGVVYVVLRIAMGLILATTVCLLAIKYGTNGFDTFTGFDWGMVIALVMLYLNSMLMSAHIVPSTIGPALQAGSWYTLGIMGGLEVLGYLNFSVLEFCLGYVTWLVLAIAIVNGVMSILKHKRTS